MWQTNSGRPEACTSTLHSPWEKEALKFQELLDNHYQIKLVTGEVGTMQCRTDGHHTVGKFLDVVFKKKGQDGKQDLEVQASLYVIEGI